MEQVIAWPGLDGLGFANIHWKPTRPVSPHDFRGKPFKELNDFMSFAQYAATKPGVYKEIYFCLSTQSTTGKLIRGNPIAVRAKASVIHYKAIWIDVDVKEGKGYATLEEALDAIFRFVADAGLPTPSAIVYSGGGVHVYWISDRPLVKAEWWSYAHGLKSEVLRLGLKCDAGLTTDEVRVLRVPGTYNNKTDTPRPVRLAHLGASYDFATALAGLAVVGGPAPVATAAVTPRTAETFPFDEKLFPKGGMHAAFVGAVDPSTDLLGSGVTLHADAPLDPKEVFRGCAHYAQARATGGKGDTQGLWMQTVLGTTWMEDGRKVAHEVSNQHKGYTPEETDAMYDRKLTERADNPNLGWPGCNAFESDGAQCKHCPFYGKLRSPLNLAQRAAVPGDVSKKAPQAPPELDLPEGYTVDPLTGWISEIVTKTTNNGESEEHLVPLFMSKLYNFEAQAGADRQLRFHTSLDGDRHGAVVLSEADDLITEQTVVKKLRHYGVKPYPRNQKGIIQFMTSFMAKLDAARTRTETVTFGWLRRNSVEVGFAYGGRVVLNDGTVQNSGTTDAQIMEKYAPVGDPDFWRPTFRLITDRHHPALHCLAAASFGAPLMWATGKYNVVVCGYSQGSGAHKSTAINLGLSVWGIPKTTKETPQSTRKGLIRHLGFIKNLPLYWDEITNEEKMDVVRSIINDTTEGANGSRMHQDRTLFETDEWQTMMIIGANLSLVQNVVKNVKNTNATLERVFEFFVEKQEDTGQSEGDVSREIEKLNYNFGHAGLLYQEVLGRDPALIKKEVIRIENQFVAQMGGASVARFRRAAAICIFAGAKIANENIGTEFKLDEMWDFLKMSYSQQSDEIVSADSVGGSKSNTANALTQFFKGHVQNALWVRSMPPMQRGKPVAVTFLAGPTPARPAAVHIRLAVTDKVIDVSKQRLSDFLGNVGRIPADVVDGLKKHFGAIQVEKISLTTGTGLLGGRETILRIPVFSGGPFVAELYAHTPPNERPEDMRTDAPVTAPVMDETPSEGGPAGA